MYKLKWSSKRKIEVFGKSKKSCFTIFIDIVDHIDVRIFFGVEKRAAAPQPLGLPVEADASFSLAPPQWTYN